MNRRDFLKLLGFGGALLTTGGTGVLLNSCDDGDGNGDGGVINLDPRVSEGFETPLLIPGDEGFLGFFGTQAPDSLAQAELPFEIVAKEISVPILPDKNTNLWVYEVNQGGRTYYNPVFRVRPGDQFSPTLRNELSEETIIHWHGLHVDHENDGHPIFAINPGETYQYNFTVQNQAATYFYHPHPHGITGRQEYRGLASFFIVEDDEEINFRNSLDLNLGETDIPLVISDKRFDEDGNLVYNLNALENPLQVEQILGFLGNVILVNLTVKPVLDVGTRIYRFRVLNGSNSRTYKIAFLNGSEKLPFYIVGNDGGLLDKPYQATEVFLGVGERVEILFDFRDLQVGDEIYLKSLLFDPMDPMVDDFMHPSDLMNGEEFYILKLRVSEDVLYDRQIPETISTITPIDTSGAGERLITLPAPIGGLWFINNNRFEMEEVAFSVSRDTTEIWDIFNGPLAMPHPMHIHTFQFQILERLNSPEQVSSLAIDDSGRLPTDIGLKDVVLIWPGETVRYALHFSLPFPGQQISLFHCHNLEHEDQGMMINWAVV